MASSPQRKFHSSLSLERRPRLLKDFLNEDYNNHSCSSTRKPCKLPAAAAAAAAAASQLLMRSRSKAASATISGALHRVINIVKFFPFASAVKSPSIFISRKLSRRTAATGKNLRHDDLRERPTVMVKVKDILRWPSSRDLVAEKSSPMDDFCYSPNRCTTATTTTGSKRSSWCDSDFTAEDLPSWCGEIDEQATVGGGVGTMKGGNNKNIFLPDETVGGYFMDDKQIMDPQFDENDQHSPVSVLQSPFREDEDFSFHRSLATIESRKCMLMQRIQQLETLAGGVGGATAPENGAEEEEEEGGGIRGANDKAKQMMIHLTTEDIISCSEESYEWEVEEKREAYIRDMEKAAGMRWYNFDEEKEELCREVEVEVFRDLVNEVLAEMFMHKLHSSY